MANIEWNKVTKLSQIAAIVLFVAVFGAGFLVGRKYENKTVLGEPKVKATFACPNKETVKADFYDRMVYLQFEGQKILLPQTMSASGARYANRDESLVFWNKGDMAFIEQNGATVLDNCVAQPPK